MICMTWFVSNLSAASHTFKTQWKNLTATATVDDTRTEYSMQVIEWEDDASIVVDLEAADVESDPATFATIGSTAGDDFASTITTNSGDLLLMSLNVPNEAINDDSDSVLRFTVGGTHEGGHGNTYSDKINEMHSGSMFLAVTGKSGSNAWAAEWQAATGANQCDAVVRTFQVVKITANFVLNEITESSTDQTLTAAVGVYTDMTDMEITYTPDGTNSVLLLNSHGPRDDQPSPPTDDEQATVHRFYDDATGVGPEAAVWTDWPDHRDAWQLTWGITSETAESVWKLRWFKSTTSFADPTVGVDNFLRAFQVIDFKAAVAGDQEELHPVMIAYG